MCQTRIKFANVKLQTISSSYWKLNCLANMACKDLKVQLPSGSYMPLIGFGTFQIHGKGLIRDVLDAAFATGYRSIDTAAVYGNEEDIGAALKELLPKYKLKREDVFITSKLPPSHHGEKATSALKNSLRNLGCDYVDLYLVHWPGQSGTSIRSPDNAQERAKTWRLFVEAKRQGLARDIGVSNYTVGHLNELLAECYGEKPAVNQIEWHPHYHQGDLKRLCDKEGILLQAYSSLGGSRNPKLITDPAVVAVANKLNKEPSQILLRWALQQNVGVIPKARSRGHIETNIDLNFEISDADMSALSGLQMRKKYAWDPEMVA